jgi:hypothetical protein
VNSIPALTLTEARVVPWTRPALKELATRLPAADQALEDLIEEAVRQRDEAAFRRLVFAAIGTERHVDARHLGQGSPLFLDASEMAVAALNCAGDVGRALIEAAQDGRMGYERMAGALALAALWYRERSDGRYPPELTVAARKLARMTTGNPLTQLTLRMLAEVVDDKALKQLLPDEPAPFLKAVEKGFWNDALNSPWTCVPATPPPQVITGYTVRRAVPRVGRNEPCPCGSGKKYKHCCIETDQDRLRQSSALPGVTLREWEAQPELGLTWERLRDLRSYELVKLDPRKVPDSLREHLLDRLIDFNELEAATRVLESATPEPSDDQFYWNWVAELAARRGELRSLRDVLKERHSERNELRRELEQAREQLDALHVESPTPAAPEESVDREPLLLESEDLGHQPVRLPASSKRFVEHFSNLPRPVARSVMLLVGRLAAGEPSAFAGVKRLRALPEVYRQRVAGDYRLLFRLRPDALELVDLVNRRDLDRCIKSLS